MRCQLRFFEETFRGDFLVTSADRRILQRDREGVEPACEPGGRE